MKNIKKDIPQPPPLAPETTNSAVRALFVEEAQEVKKETQNVASKTGAIQKKSIRNKPSLKLGGSGKH